MQVLLVEDEELSVERLQRQLLTIDSTIIISGIAGSIKAAVSWLQQNPAPDLILMDIELSDGQCFNIFRQTEITSRVIFVTSFDESAMHLFRKNNFQYLLKPVRLDELEAALTKIRSEIPKAEKIDIESLIASFKKQEYRSQIRNRLLVKQGHSIRAIETSAIAYIFMNRQYCYVRARDGETYSVQHKLDLLEEMLDPKEFYRVNTEFIIHRSAITALHPQNGSSKLILNPETEKEIRLNQHQLHSLMEWKKR